MIAIHHTLARLQLLYLTVFYLLPRFLGFTSLCYLNPYYLTEHTHSSVYPFSRHAPIILD